MARVKANGIELEYDTFGDPADPALVLVMGLGTQLTAWRPEFCQAVAAHGYHVIRFDNRDIGLSTRIDATVPEVATVLGGDHSSVPYLIADLADDTVGLLDALGIESAHFAGVSMGGMIVQQIAIDHPARIRSLCSIMSTTGDHTVGAATPEVLTILLAPPATNRDEAVDHGELVFATIGSPAHPAGRERLREQAADAYDRSFRPEGTARQLIAIIASPDRTAGLHGVTAPSIVVHGDSDKLIDVSGGHATAAALSDCEIVVVPGMGHDLPEALWGTLIDTMVRNARRAA